jgi:hypothetical protein
MRPNESVLEPVAATAVPAADLARRTLERRAVEAVIWGMPIVSVDAMRQAFFRDAGARYNDIVYLSKPADWRLQVTTPNASSYYVYIQINTKGGALVLDVPPATGAGLFGSINDAWQAPLADVGPAGDDQGKGARYLLLPPGHARSVPMGYFPVPFATYNGYSLLRAIPATSSPADIAQALDLVKKIRIYPLAEADHPPTQRHIDVAGLLFDGIARFDATFYDSLARMVNEEPVQTRDLVAMAGLRSLGIEKGHAFTPATGTREALAMTVREAHACFVSAATAGEPFWPNARWILPAGHVGPQTGFRFETPDRLEIDERGTLFFLGCAPPKRLGAATFYVFGVRDAKDRPLLGDRTYRLHVPADVPVRQFWAVTVYDLETAAFIRDSPRIEVNSYQKLQKNTDGSIDVHFAPRAPTSGETNWIYTAPGKRWIAAFRFYGPDKAVFDKTWRLGEITEIS